MPSPAAASAAIQRLTVDNYYKTVKLTYDVADEHGLNVDGVGWYIKVCIDRTVPEVVVISFHPPQRPMRTKAGMVSRRESAYWDSQS